MRLEKRAACPHSCQTTSVNASAAALIVATASTLIPITRGERVVEEAVGDERVAAAVPEVVPEGEAVLEEERPLVGVRREVDARRAEPNDEGRQGRGDRR